MIDNTTLNSTNYDEVYEKFQDFIENCVDKMEDKNLQSLFNQLHNYQIEFMCNSCFDEWIGDIFEYEEGNKE